MPLVWLYVGDVHAIHIAPFPEGETQRFQDKYLGGRRTDATYGSGVIPIICGFSLYRAARDDFAPGFGRANYLKRQANDGDLFQLFIDAPNGIRIELNFAAAEADAAGVKPDLSAAEAVAEA